MTSYIVVIESKSPSKAKRKKLKKRTGSVSTSDQSYVSKAIAEYVPNLEVSNIKYVSLHGKTNYNSESIKKQIAELKNNFTANGSEQVKVIYIFDKDSDYTNPNQHRINREIESYVGARQEYLVWFCPNIDKVFLGRNSKDKTSDAAKFKITDSNRVELKHRLSNSNPSTNGSNFLNVLRSVT